MTEEDAGKSFITLDMDETRELRWDFRNIQKFEKRSREILKRLEIKVPQIANINGRPVEIGAPRPAWEDAVHAGHILSNYLKLSEIQEAAVAAACGISGLPLKGEEESEASRAIQGYLNKGGSLEALQREIYHAYLVVNDPSTIGEWEENIARIEETKRINREKVEAQMEIARMELAEDQKKILTLQKLSGSVQPESA